MLKTQVLRIGTSLFIVTLLFSSFGSIPTFAKTKQEECIAKTMPWDDASKCAPKLAKKTATGAVAGATSAPGGSLNAELLFEMINARRAELGLAAYQKDERLCQIARDRGPALYNEIFVTGNMHAGFKALNLPYWATENMISLGSEQAAFNWWMNSSVHRRAIENPNYTHSCGACYGNSCAQIFTSFQSK